MKIPFDNFTIRSCTIDNLDEILALQKNVVAGLPSPDILRENTVQMLSDCLNPPHVTLGAWYGLELAAISVLYFPESESEDLAHLLQDINSSEYICANNKLCMVSEDFRGNGLQFFLGKMLEEYALKAGVSLMCATVSPKNSYSIQNVTRLGYKYNRTLVKYGFERNLYFKFLDDESK